MFLSFRHIIFVYYVCMYVYTAAVPVSFFVAPLEVLHKKPKQRGEKIDRLRVPPETTYFSMNSEKHSMSHNTRVTNTDEIRRERRHASSRARLPQPHFLLAAHARKLSLGGGRRKMPSAEQRRRCSYRSLERIRFGLSVGSRAVWDIRSGCRHSCSVVCRALRISTSTSTCHQ